MNRVGKAIAPKRSKTCLPRAPFFVGGQLSPSRRGESRGRRDQRSLTFRPARSPNRPRRSVSPEASTDSLPPPPLRLLAAGATRCRVGIAPTGNRRLFTMHSILTVRASTGSFCLQLFEDTISASGKKHCAQRSGHKETLDDYSQPQGQN